MKATLGISILAAMMALAGGARAQSSGTNGAPAVPADTNAAAKIEPLIEMHDVPVSMAIETLARQAGVNYLPVPGLFQRTNASGRVVAESTADFRLKNVSAKEVLTRLLDLHHLVLMEDPVSNIGILARASQSTNRLFAGMTEEALRFNHAHTNQIQPLIQFSDVPITTAIENLARLEEVNYMLDYKVRRSWGVSGIGTGPEPIVTLRLEQVTCWNTLNRMLNAYGLMLVDNPVTQVWMVRGADKPPQKLDVSLLGLDTNSPATLTNGVIPLIQFSDVPLWEALENLIRQASLPMTLDPRFKNGSDPLGQITLSLRWENMSAKVAIVALCQDYDLNIVEDTAAEKLRIEPGREWK